MSRNKGVFLGLASQAVPVVKNLFANAQDLRDAGSIPGLGRSPGEGHGNTLQCSCLENPMDGVAWWAVVLGVARQKRLSTHAQGTEIGLWGWFTGVRGWRQAAGATAVGAGA